MPFFSPLSHRFAESLRNPGDLLKIRNGSDWRSHLQENHLTSANSHASTKCSTLEQHRLVKLWVL